MAKFNSIPASSGLFSHIPYYHANTNIHAHRTHSHDIIKGGCPSLRAPRRRIALMIFMNPTVASNRTVGTFVSEDTPSLKVSAPSPYRYSPFFQARAINLVGFGHVLADL